MGQYHFAYNLDKKEYVHGHDLDNGLKLLEQIGHAKSTADAVFLLSAVSNGRGGGDSCPHPFIGRWGGDRIAVIGDYHEQDDLPGFDFSELESFENISPKVNEMLSVAFRDD